MRPPCAPMIRSRQCAISCWPPERRAAGQARAPGRYTPDMPLNIDLHSHSSRSDGVLAPAQVAARAHAQGVDWWSLSDHDETSGLAEAAAAARDLGMGFIPGVE